MKKLLSGRIAIVVVAVIATVAFFSFKSGDDRNFQIAKNLDIFNAIVKELDMFYVDTIDPNKTIREGIDNMLFTLDPYTEYFPEEDQSELEQMIKGSFGGIGSYIAYNTKLKRSMISEPFEGTPAAKAGLKAGDILMEIDGKDLAGKNNAEVSQMLRGQAGTSFKLKVNRPNAKGGNTPMEFTIVRESIQNPAIPYAAVLDNQVGYINLSTFSGNPSKEFKKAFLDLKKQGATSLVIDLRGNGGGLLDEAVEIANYFLPRGKVIVTTKGKIKQASNTYKTLREPLDLDIPIAVLVNSGTASASEILSGSLQDLDRAVIVGNRTFGKGLVQVPRSLPYGGTMKVTTSKYYIPSGRCVQAIDYKHRNEDGSVGTIPDSLTKVFYTAAGREVRDGGGVMPDITIKQEKLPNILFYLVRDNLIFDYATQYCLKHPTIVAPEKFEVTDADYNDFKALVKKADFKYDQQSEKILKTLKEAAEFVRTADGLVSASAMLERFLFPPEQQYSPVGKLSGGEKRRLYLLRVLMSAPNVLILDEPTNDLDVETLAILEDYLDGYDGIVITVSHDRYFLDRIAKRIFAFEGAGKIVQYEGGYTDYMNKRPQPASGKTVSENASSTGASASGAQGNTASDGTDSKEARKKKSMETWGHEKKLKFTYKEQKEYETIEADIEKLENRLSEIDDEMVKNATNFGKLNELTKEKEDLEGQLMEKMERWEYLEDLAQKIANLT